MTSDALLCTADAALYLGISVGTLRLSRSQSESSRKRIKWTPPLGVWNADLKEWYYTTESLDSWLEKNGPHTFKRNRRGRPRLGQSIEGEKHGSI